MQDSSGGTCKLSELVQDPAEEEPGCADLAEDGETGMPAEREQGEQMEHKSVEQYLAEKYDIKTGVGTSGEDRREQREE